MYRNTYTQGAYAKNSHKNTLYFEKYKKDKFITKRYTPSDRK
jgi:hypothetical protein